jgi:hypothetical protein
MSENITKQEEADARRLDQLLLACIREGLRGPVTAPGACSGLDVQLLIDHAEKLHEKLHEKKS